MALRYAKNLSALLLGVLVSGCCFPNFWYAWNYEFEQKPELGNFYLSPFTLPGRVKYQNLYVNGAYVSLRVMAHNETTESGDPPYHILVNVTSELKSTARAVFHGVRVDSSLNLDHRVTPVEVDKRAVAVRSLQFPVSLPIKTDRQQHHRATLWAAEDLQFQPDNGEIVTFVIDLEVVRGNSRERKEFRLKFLPQKKSGSYSCISA